MTAAEQLHLEKEHLLYLMQLAKLGTDMGAIYGRCFLFRGHQTKESAPFTISSQITGSQPLDGDVLRLSIFSRRVSLEIRPFGRGQRVFPVTKQTNWLVFTPKHGWVLEIDREANQLPEWFDPNLNPSERFDDPNQYIPGDLELL